MRRFYTGWLLILPIGRHHPVTLLLKGAMFWPFYLGPLFTIPFHARDGLAAGILLTSVAAPLSASGSRRQFFWNVAARLC
jgi:hypothetical protein